MRHSIIATIVFAYCFGRCAVATPAESELQAAIARIGSGTGPEYYSRELELFMRAPEIAARLLIDELHVIEPVPPWVLPPETSNTPENLRALHIVWCMRALRYITGGVEFAAPTSHMFSRQERFREQWLRKRAPSSGQVPFFSTRMSTDTVFIAPPDAQASIINKWRAWFAEEGSGHSYEPPKRLEDWYF